MAKNKTVSLEKMLGNLTPEQRKEFAFQYNGGLGSGMTSEEYRQHIENVSKDEPPKKRPSIEENVWSRFDDDGYGIYNVQPPKSADKGNE